MRSFMLMSGDKFFAHIWADRIDVPVDNDGCFFFYRNGDLCAGTGSRSLGVRIFGDEGEILPVPAFQPEMEHFYAEASK